MTQDTLSSKKYPVTVWTFVSTFLYYLGSLLIIIIQRIMSLLGLVFLCVLTAVALECFPHIKAAHWLSMASGVRSHSVSLVATGMFRQKSQVVSWDRMMKWDDSTFRFSFNPLLHSYSLSHVAQMTAKSTSGTHNIKIMLLCQEEKSVTVIPTWWYLDMGLSWIMSIIQSSITSWLLQGKRSWSR